MSSQLANAIAASAVRLAALTAENLPELEVTAEQASKAAKSMVEQDSVPKSKRLWSALLGVLSAVLMYPGIQEELMHLVGSVIPPLYLPMATVTVGALLSLLSKRADPRPMRS